MSSNCTRQKKRSLTTIKINNNIRCESLLLSDIASELKIVPLETNPNCIIDHFSELLLVNDNNIIFKSSNQILIFDSNGKYLIKIDAFGRGPEEYNTLISTFIDEKKEYIYIADYDNIKIFNFKGNFIKKLDNIPTAYGMLKHSVSGQLFISLKQLYAEQNRNALYLIDSLHKFKNIISSPNKDICNEVNQNLFYVNSLYELDKRIFFKEPFIDTIYEIIDTTLVPYIAISAGALQNSTCEGINTESFAKSKNINTISFKETINNFFIKYYYMNSIYYSVYDKEKNEYVFYKKYSEGDFPNGVEPTFGFNNNLMADAPVFWPDYIEDEYIVSIIKPISLTNSQLNYLNIKVDDNQILFVGKLNK